MGNTFTGHESSVPEDASVTRLCLTNAFLAGQTNTTSNPPPFANDLQKSKRFVRVVANKFKMQLYN